MLEGRDGQPTFFQDAGTEGFVWLELNATEIYGVVYDANGAVQFERRVTR